MFHPIVSNLTLTPRFYLNDIEVDCRLKQSRSSENLSSELCLHLCMCRALTPRDMFPSQYKDETTRGCHAIRFKGLMT